MAPSPRTNDYAVISQGNKTNHVTTSTTEIELDHLNSNQRQPVDPNTNYSHLWQPGFWKQFPWMGMGCLAAALHLTFAAMAILLASNNKAVSQWDKRVAPNVILSLLNSAASVCIAVAVSQAIAIAWWRRAIRGASIEELHHSWSFGTSFSSIFLGYKFFNICALAALVTKFTIIDGVLFQRATTTYIALGPQGFVNVSTYPTQTFPVTGYLNQYANDTRILADSFTYDIATWVESSLGNVYFTYGFGECEGVCYVEVPVPGYMVTCTNTTRTVDLVADAIARQNATANETQTEFNLFDVDFDIEFGSGNETYPRIMMNLTSYTRLNLSTSNPNARCPGQLLTQTCELRPALLTYPTFMQFTNISSKGRDSQLSKIDIYIGGYNATDYTYTGLDSFDYDHKQIPGFNFLNWTTFSSNPPQPLAATTNGGIMTALKNQYKSRAYITTTSLAGENWTLSTQNQLAGIQEDAYDDVTGYDTVDWSCPYSYDDPISSIVGGLNTLTFITADDLYNRPAYNSSFTDDQASAYYNSSVHYVQAIQHLNEVHYQTNYNYMIGAIVSTIICVLGVLPAYWGWWELGRKVTLNPIEVANAFEAPALAAVHSGNGHADDVVRAAGGQIVRYEEVLDEKCGRKYTFVVH